MKQKRMKGILLYQVGSLLPLMLMFSIMASIYCIYMGTYVIPLINGTYEEVKLSEMRIDSKHFPFLIQVVSWNDLIVSNFDQMDHYRKGVSLAVCVHFLIVLLGYTILKVKLTEAGRVPQDWIEEINSEIHTYISNENAIMNECIEKRNNQKKKLNESIQIDLADQSQNSTQSELENELRMELNLRAKIELIEKQGKRFCKYCVQFKVFVMEYNIVKPIRCHHCRQCQVCWMKMDHHCQWLNTCIGSENYKVFINMISYAWCCLFFVGFTYTRCFFDSLFDQNKSDVELFLINFNFLFTLMLLVLVSSFCLFHFWLISVDKTTLEYCESKKFEQSDESSTCSNFLGIFGSNPLIWVLPIKPD